MTRVLVIDDEAPIRLLCRVNLEAEGMEVLEASDGPTGLEKARNEEPDVILLDVMMPGLDGWQVAEELLDSESTSSIPIVFLTARAEVRDRARGLDLGGIDYVTKPFNPVELAPLVLDLIDRVDRGERDELRREKIAELRDLIEPPLSDRAALTVGAGTGLCPVGGSRRDGAALMEKGRLLKRRKPRRRRQGGLTGNQFPRVR